MPCLRSSVDRVAAPTRAVSSATPMTPSAVRPAPTITALRTARGERVERRLQRR